MNPDQRDGLRELSDWVASMRARSPSPVDDLDRLIAGVDGGRVSAEASTTTGEVSAVDAADASDLRRPTNGDDRSDSSDAPVAAVDSPDAAGQSSGAEDGTDEADRAGRGATAAGTASAASPATPTATSGATSEPQAGGDDGGTGDETADDGDDDGERKKRSPGRVLFDWIVVIGVALFVAFVIRTFVLAHFVVDGTSMASTLHSGDRVFVNKLSYRLHDPNRGDVIVLHELDGTSQRDLIKRVIALEGETIEMRDCEVYIDGKLLEEPYLDPELVKPGQCGAQIPPTKVEEDHVFVMGDNRNGSQDSRVLGTIDEDEIVGRAFVVFWPFDNWQWL